MKEIGETIHLNVLMFFPRTNEVFLDCGCFNGSSAFGFATWCGELSYDKIICFEPDSKLYEKSDKVVSNLKDCFLYQYGISDKTGKASFLVNGQEDAHIVSSDIAGDIQSINTVDLDSFLDGERVTFIKMDIEGAEYDTLTGVPYIIKRQKQD